MSELKAIGIDIGSTTTKLIGVDGKGAMLWHVLEPAEPRVEDQVARNLDRLRQEFGSLEGLPVVATGYGRRLVRQATRQLTEITCHARGIFHEFGHGGTLVDIGGQDSKVIAINPAGRVVDFVMNDKCAAGTGRFLENTAGRLHVALECLGEEAMSGAEEAAISSTCTVFAESEVISLIAHGTPLQPILRGLHRALIRRIEAMIRSVGFVSPLMLSGGVAKNLAIRCMLEEAVGERPTLPGYPQLVGAQGAALLALGGNQSR